MRYELLDTPDFGMVRAGFDQPGEALVVESGALLLLVSGVQM